MDLRSPAVEGFAVHSPHAADDHAAARRIKNSQLEPLQLDAGRVQLQRNSSSSSLASLDGPQRGGHINWARLSVDTRKSAPRSTYHGTSHYGRSGLTRSISINNRSSRPGSRSASRPASRPTSRPASRPASRTHSPYSDDDEKLGGMSRSSSTNSLVGMVKRQFSGHKPISRSASTNSVIGMLRHQAKLASLTNEEVFMSADADDLDAHYGVPACFIDSPMDCRPSRSGNFEAPSELDTVMPVSGDFEFSNPFEQKAEEAVAPSPSALAPWQDYYATESNTPNGKSGSQRALENVRQSEWEMEDCAICQDATPANPVNVILTPCHHVFHASCIIAWVEIHYSCPLCRQSIEMFIPSERVTYLERVSGVEATQSTLNRLTKAWEQHYYRRRNDQQHRGEDDGEVLVKKHAEAVESDMAVLQDVSNTVATVPPEELSFDHADVLHSVLYNVLGSAPDTEEAFEETLPFVAQSLVVERKVVDNVAPFLDTPEFMAVNGVPIPLLEILPSEENVEGGSVSHVQPHRPKPRSRRYSPTSSGVSASSEEPQPLSLLSGLMERIAPSLFGEELEERSGSMHAFLDHMETGLGVIDEGDVADEANVPESSSVREDESSMLLFPSLQHLEAGAIAGLTAFTTVRASHTVAQSAANVLASSNASLASRAPALSAALRPTASLIPSAAVYFTGYEALKEMLGVDMSNNSNQRAQNAVSCGVAAGGAAIAANLASLIRTPALRGVIPLQFAVQFSVFEQMKALLRSDPNTDSSALEVAAAMTTGGVAAGVAVHPFAAGAGLSTPHPTSILRSVGSTVGRILPTAICCSLAYEFGLRFMKSRDQPLLDAQSLKRLTPDVNSPAVDDLYL